MTDLLHSFAHNTCICKNRKRAAHVHFHASESGKRHSHTTQHTSFKGKETCDNTLWSHLTHSIFGYVQYTHYAWTYFQQRHTRSSLWAYEFDLVNLREWHPADPFLLSWHPFCQLLLLHSGRRKYSCPVFPLCSTETSQYSLPHHFFCSHSHVCLSVCLWPFHIAHISFFFNVDEYVREVIKWSELLLESSYSLPLKTHISNHHYIFILATWYVRCLTNLNKLPLTRIWWNWFNSITVLCHIGWNPKIRDTSPLRDTEVITFHLIKLFGWPLWQTCGINKRC